eukprot:scaffold2848_cov352-Pavlova_lutheri.AAC.3
MRDGTRPPFAHTWEGGEGPPPSSSIHVRRCPPSEPQGRGEGGPFRGGTNACRGGRRGNEAIRFDSTPPIEGKGSDRSGTDLPFEPGRASLSIRRRGVPPIPLDPSGDASENDTSWWCRKGPWARWRTPHSRATWGWWGWCWKGCTWSGRIPWRGGGTVSGTHTWKEPGSTRAPIPEGAGWCPERSPPNPQGSSIASNIGKNNNRWCAGSPTPNHNPGRDGWK